MEFKDKLIDRAALVAGRLARKYGFTDMDGTQPLWGY
jgi:hypothetical protein